MKIIFSLLCLSLFGQTQAQGKIDSLSLFPNSWYRTWYTSTDSLSEIDVLSKALIEDQRDLADYYLKRLQTGAHPLSEEALTKLSTHALYVSLIIEDLQLIQEILRLGPNIYLSIDTSCHCSPLRLAESLHMTKALGLLRSYESQSQETDWNKAFQRAARNGVHEELLLAYFALIDAYSIEASEILNANKSYPALHAQLQALRDTQYSADWEKNICVLLEEACIETQLFFLQLPGVEDVFSDQIYPIKSLKRFKEPKYVKQYDTFSEAFQLWILHTDQACTRNHQANQKEWKKLAREYQAAQKPILARLLEEEFDYMSVLIIAKGKR